MGKSFIPLFSLFFALLVSFGLNTQPQANAITTAKALSVSTASQSAQIAVDHIFQTGRSPIQYKFKIRIKALNDCAVSDKPSDLFTPVLYPRAPGNSFLPYRQRLKTGSKYNCSNKGPPSFPA